MYHYQTKMPFVVSWTCVVITHFDQYFNFFPVTSLNRIIMHRFLADGNETLVIKNDMFKYFLRLQTL